MSVTDPATGKVRFAIVPAAYVFLLRDCVHGPEVLLQLRQGTGYMDGHWAAAAAGHIEAGETAEAAAAREAAEEIGVHDLALEFVTAMQRTGRDLAIDERVDFFFVARSWIGDPHIVEPDKSADLRWWPLSALPDPVVPHEAAVLRGIRDHSMAPLSHFGF
ncbi:NUDIX domain-containing protein [Nocardioides sp. YIM 152588]|uniref:NUDIX domain-containing protein n=1 Tax=Nocardioides sp. YIM 152588 TaxID=3158259 RepID=UPI0032E4125C